MKKLIYLLLVAAIMPFITSCENDDKLEINKDIPATISEIQGAWQCYRNGTYFNIEFKGNYYELNISNVFNASGGGPGGDGQVDDQLGTFTMEGPVITLSLFDDATENPQFDTLEAYWTDAKKTQLYLIPIGAFTRL